MELLLLLIPVLLVLIVLAAMVRRRRARWKIDLPPQGRPGEGPAGTREPRRPRVPSGEASAALPLPREDQPVVAVASSGETSLPEDERRRGAA